MKKRSFFLSFFLLITFYASAQSETTIVDSILSGNMYRTYRLYIPKSYDVTIASSLVLDLHGYTSNADQQQLYSNFKSISDTANFLIVYPNGTPTTAGGPQFWNAGLSPALVNDVAFLSELIDHIKSAYTIDANRVYACGMSNGGFMSHTLACALSHKIAAIASVTGSMFTAQYQTCTPNRVVPVLQIHGTEDKTVPYTGNTSMLAIDTLINFWVNHDRCDPIPTIDSVLDINKADSCTAVHYVYKNGLQGSTCELYKIIAGGHSWPGAFFKIDVTNQDFNASEKIWQFFRKYKLSDMLTVPVLTDAPLITLYPNPCINQLYVEAKQLQSVTILDITGKVVLKSTQKEMDVNGLAKGIYSVIITTKEGQVVRRLVK